MHNFTRRWPRRFLAVWLVVCLGVGTLAVTGCDRDDESAADQQDELQQDEAPVEQQADEEPEGVDLEAAEQRADDKWSALSLEEPVDADKLHGFQSAAAVYTFVQFLVMLAPAGDDGGEAALTGDIDEEFSCPEMEEHDDGTVEITGGCTDEEDREWTGSAHIEPKYDRTYGLTGPMLGEEDKKGGEFQLATVTSDLSASGAEPCESDPDVQLETSIEIDGEVTLDQVGDEEYEFGIDLWFHGDEADHANCEITEEAAAFIYQGAVTLQEVDDEGHSTAHTWNGDGVIVDEGSWHRAETTDQVFDLSQCETTPMSGATTLHSEGKQLEFRYIGAERCEMEAEAEWYLDGEKMGTIESVYCSNVGGVSGSVGAALLLLLAVAKLRREQSPLISTG